MMKQGSLLRWSSSNGGNKWTKNHGKPNWIHPPDALQHGHVAYLVKFLGKTEVDQPKGIDVVKEGIRKMKFSQHLRRAEGAKTPKVELTISVDGVAIQDPKSKKISFQYPLHRISYCADDKSDPKFFSFIAKEADSNRHSCFVFVSDKLSEEITLTIGQAFELAYRRFLETSGRDLEMRKQIMVLHKKVQELEAENRSLKNRLANFENKSVSSNKSSGRSSILTNGSETTNTKLQPLQPPPPPVIRFANRNHYQQPIINLLDIDDQPIVGRKLENLSLDDQKFDPRSLDESNILNTATSTTTTIGSSLSSSSTNSSNSSVSSSSSSPPLSMITTPNQPTPVSSLSASTIPITTTMTTTITSNGPINSYQANGHANNLAHTNGIDNGHNQDTNEDKDIFGFEPFDPETNKINDPFGMESFEAKQLEQAIGDIDKRLAEMRDGFSRGLSFGNVDFSIETLANT